MLSSKGKGTCITILVGLTYSIVFSQAVSPYNFQLADNVLKEEFLKGTFWTMPTDDNDICHFASKADARRTATIKAVPVVRLSKGPGSVRFQPEYSIYVGFLFRQDSFLCPLYVFSSTNRHLNQ
jgi:hypothetical protein